jgi:hypothetical protein
MVQDLLSRRVQLPWFIVTMAELAKRGMVQEVVQSGADFIANRKPYGIQFSQHCFVNHTNLPTGRSSDLFCRQRPFGIYPFLLNTPSYFSRFLSAFFVCGICVALHRRCCVCKLPAILFSVWL